MAAEDAGGSGDLAILVNTEMIVLKGAVKAAASAGSVTGKVVNKALLSPFRLIQFCMKLHKQHIISTSDFKSFTQFMKACDGDYIIANLPTRDPEQLDKLMDSMTEVGITYCLLPDLDIQDSCQQIAIRGKDVAKWQALYESYVTNQLDLGGPLDFEELKALTSGNYKIKSLALGDASEDNEQLEQFLDILDERGVNYSVLPDLKYGDNHIQIAVANQSLQQFAAAIKAYLEEFPDAAKNLVEDITEQEYFDSGRMSEEDYMKTASPEIKEKTDPKNWQKGKNLNAQSFEQALAGKEVDRYETLKNRPGLIERYIPSQRVAARREDEIALQTGDREYVRIQEALSVDNGKGFIIFLDPEKNYNVYRPDEKGILQTPSGSLSGKEFSKYTEQSDETHRLDYIPYAETETPSEAPQKQSSKAKSMEKTVSQSSPDVSTQEAAFPVTINCSLVDDIMDDKTFISRIPGSKLHIKLPLFSIADDGKTLVSAIDPQKEYEIFKNDSPTSNPLLNMKGAQILPYYDPVRRKNITKQFGQNQNKILKFSQNPASKHKPKSSPTAAFSTLTHEFGHALAHGSVEESLNTNLHQKEFEADVMSIMFCQHYGLEITDERKSHLSGHYKDWKKSDPNNFHPDKSMRKMFDLFREHSTVLDQKIVKAFPELATKLLPQELEVNSEKKKVVNKTAKRKPKKKKTPRL